ncbi:MAG: A/G-specific adenine glycosylase [Acidimicrobiia bacterium]|nr:A/G-specific adenine glycosylase [Acidimicrobiia bacterium]
MNAAVREARNDALEAWFVEQAIDYPWRDVGDPYLVLVSEVMLQQTQAPRVVPFFEAFIERFPNVESLAQAPLNEVLKLWSGLGYNSRAKRLRDAAVQVAKDGWPADLTDLPGVGPYTASALAAFAFGKQAAAVDTNLRRVLSRWVGEPLDGAALDHVAAELLGGDAALWNQAVMDLGAYVCVARSPRCGDCPVVDWCSGPDAYVAPRPQGRFEGSNRQARGAVLRALLDGRRTAGEIIAGDVVSADGVSSAIDQLVTEGLVIESAEGFALAE